LRGSRRPLDTISRRRLHFSRRASSSSESLGCLGFSGSVRTMIGVGLGLGKDARYASSCARSSSSVKCDTFGRTSSARQRVSSDCVCRAELAQPGNQREKFATYRSAGRKRKRPQALIAFVEYCLIVVIENPSVRRACANPYPLAFTDLLRPFFE